MSSLHEFSIGGNRDRPKYAFQRKECPNCGGSIPLYSEQSQLVVCQYCGSSLDCTKEELTALGKNKKSAFVFALHQEGIFEGIKYKVIARMCVRDQWNDITREYLLFHPFYGTRWLSEYQNSYSLSYSCRARDKSLSFENPQDMIRTGDGRMWNVESSTTMTLVNVDGALPWMASVGDKTKVVEYIENQNSGSYLTVEQENDGKEVSYSYSRAIDRTELFASFGLNQFGFPNANPKYKKWVQNVAVLVMVLSFVLGIFSRTRTEVAKMNVRMSALADDGYGGKVYPSFYLSSEDVQSFIQVEYRSYRAGRYAFLISKEPVDTIQTIQEIEELEKEMPPEKETRIVEPTNAISLRSEIFYIFSNKFFKSLDRIGSSQEYPTRKLLKFEKPGHYRVWSTGCTSSRSVEDCYLVISKDIQPTRYYIFLFFLSAIVWFQARRTA